MGSTLMLLMLAGGRLGPNMIRMVTAARKESVERWRVFLQFIQSLIFGFYFWYRGTAKTLDAAGLPVYSDEATNKLVTANNNDQLFREFLRPAVEKAIDALMEIIKPSVTEEILLEAIAGGGMLGGGSSNNVVVNQTRKPTAREVRDMGGRAQAVRMADGSFTVELN
ncbi:MAG: hypothetical protein U1A78_41620 [Polyangia bacterium]